MIRGYREDYVVESGRKEGGREGWMDGWVDGRLWRPSAATIIRRENSESENDLALSDFSLGYEPSRFLIMCSARVLTIKSSWW